MSILTRVWLLSFFALGCQPWWRTQYVPHDGDQAAAIACVGATAKATGIAWSVVQYDPDDFWRGVHRYAVRLRPEPTYLATYDEVSVDATRRDLRVRARGYHEYANHAVGRYQERTRPGPAARDLVTAISIRCRN